jgi:hypothetical protein
VTSIEASRVGFGDEVEQLRGARTTDCDNVGDASVMAGK